MYKVNAFLENEDTIFVFNNGIEVERNSPSPVEKNKKAEPMYQGSAFLKEGWNRLREEFIKLTNYEFPQIHRVSLYIPENKTKVSYGEFLKLKIEGKYLKDQSVEYTVYEDDTYARDELDSGIVQMKGDVQELEIQLTKEMYKKGGTGWFELIDGTHEIYVSVKLKGKMLAQSTGIIEVDTSTMVNESIPGNRAVVTGEPDRIRDKEDNEVIEEKKLNEDDCVVILTGEPVGYGQASAYRGKYLMYKVNIYNGINYDTYLINKKNNQLPKPIITKLARDAWNKTQRRSKDRYGRKNETPPGIYWLTYFPKGIGSKGYKLKVSDTKDGDYIYGKHGRREGIRIHHYSPHFSEGCITTGNNEISSINSFIEKIPPLKVKPIRLIIEERKIKYENNLYKGIK